MHAELQHSVLGVANDCTFSELGGVFGLTFPASAFEHAMPQTVVLTAWGRGEDINDVAAAFYRREVDFTLDL